jgi:hypothetical protein
MEEIGGCRLQNLKFLSVKFYFVIQSHLPLSWHKEIYDETLVVPNHSSMVQKDLANDLSFLKKIFAL